MIRLVVDTNLLVSAFLWGGKPAQFIQQARNLQIRLITTDELTAELEDVLFRDKFAKTFVKIGRTPTSVMDEYQQLAERVLPVPVSANAVNDPDDLAVLAAAVGGQADYIVSGDDHLLRLGEFNGIPILTAADVLTQLE